VLWNEVVELEPQLLAIEAWVRTLDPCDPTVLDQIKAKLLPLVGWKRTIPGHEEVPFDEHWPAIWSEKQHDCYFGNDARKKLFFLKVPIHLRPLYTSEAWDAALDHLTAILKARAAE
jgi:hypothetical protein